MINIHIFLEFSCAFLVMFFFKLLSYLTDTKKYEIIKRDILSGKSVPHYAAIEPDGNGLMIASYKSFQFVQTGQNFEENMDEDTSEKIKGNFTFNPRAILCLCIFIFLYVCLSTQVIVSTRAR